MTAIVINTANHNKKYSGEIMRRGMGTITLYLWDKKGSSMFKTFNESKWAVHTEKSGR